jgi:hypothetical protein
MDLMINEKETKRNKNVHTFSFFGRSKGYVIGSKLK